jgi:ADP-ribosyl-[dinitrogen reductase] hydrolase
MSRDTHDPTSGALRVDELAIPGGGVIGMTHLPGRRHVDGGGRRWERDLEADLDAIEAWGARAVVTLVESREFQLYGVPDFIAALRRRRFAWLHLPIADMAIPGPGFATAWDREGPGVLARIAAGERILVHCAGGLGRTGMFAARILVEFGAEPAVAIAAVRAVRPGAIETPAQERFVLARAALGSPVQRIGGA